MYFVRESQVLVAASLIAGLGVESDHRVHGQRTVADPMVIVIGVGGGW